MQPAAQPPAFMQPPSMPGYASQFASSLERPGVTPHNSHHQTRNHRPQKTEANYQFLAEKRRKALDDEKAKDPYNHYQDQWPHFVPRRPSSPNPKKREYSKRTW